MVEIYWSGSLVELHWSGSLVELHWSGSLVKLFTEVVHLWKSPGGVLW